MTISCNETEIKHFSSAVGNKKTPTQPKARHAGGSHLEYISAPALAVEILIARALHFSSKKYHKYI